MNRTLRSQRNRPPNTLGVHGRALSTPSVRSQFGICFRVEDDPEQPVIYLDNSGVHNVSKLPKQLFTSASNILQQNGYCTWILTKVDNKFEVYGSRTLTSFEIGSKHRNLYFDMGKPTVYAAGECQVIRTRGNIEVRYNFESGTFMRYIVDMYYQHANVSKQPTDYYKDFMDRLWANAGATIVRYTPEPMFQSMPNSMPKYVVEAYRSAGYIPYKFMDEQTCTQYRRSLETKHVFPIIESMYESAKYRGFTGDFSAWLEEHIASNPDFAAFRPHPTPPVYVGGKTRRVRKRSSKKLKHK